MNLRLSILLVAVLVFFGGTFLVVRFTGSQERIPDEPWLFQMDEGAITHIVATHKGQTVNYEKKLGSLNWFILEDPELPVNFEKWAGTPLLLSGPRVNRVLSDTIDDPVSYGLDPAETSVKVTERGGQGFEFHMGISTPDSPTPTPAGGIPPTVHGAHHLGRGSQPSGHRTTLSKALRD